MVDGLSAEAHVNVEEGCRVTGVPAGDYGELAAGYGPFGAISRYIHATARILPLHFIAKGVSAPGGVFDGEVGGGKGGEEEEGEEGGE